MTSPKPGIVGKECKFAVHIASRHPDQPDLHLIKERLHFSDGSTRPSVKIIENYKRPFYITKKTYRNHKDKKECEDINKLDCYQCTQSELRYRLARALDRGGSRESIKELSINPYVYGTDISSTSHIKHAYRQQYPDFQSAYDLAIFDTETDVLHGTNDVIMASAVFKNKVFLGIRNDVIAGIANPKERILQKYNHYLKEYVDKLDLELEVCFFDTSFDVVKGCFKKFHEWQPDIVAIWNLDFDIPKVVEMCRKAGIAPENLFSDPSVPVDRRHFRYKEGQRKLITASGKFKPIPPSAQWHTVDTPAGFYLLDAMCVYRLLRLAKQEERSYALDAILRKELNITKLKFKEAEKYEGLRWHQYMQQQHILEYSVYNIFDSLSMMELDKKTKDLSFTLPAFAGITDFSNFRSQPKRITDSIYFYLFDKGFILAATGTRFQPVLENDPLLLDEETDTINDEDDNDDESEETQTTLDLRNWILTLPATLVASNGMQCIEEDERLRTNIRSHVFDSDVEGAYPTAVVVGNVSKATTVREIITINGVDEMLFRAQNINCLSGATNAVEYCTAMFNLPTPDNLLIAFMESKK